MKTFGNKFPQQLKRLAIVAVILLALLVFMRRILVPSDFGTFGHFRASAVEDIALQKIQYAGQVVCLECHEDIVGTKNAGYHKNVACEVCHGPAAAHTAGEDTVGLQIPTSRARCLLCHEYLSSRPTGFPQIVSESHNPMKLCVSCHNPHDPRPSEAPKGCEACHATIARTKSLSHHVYVDCERCHTTPEQHKINPREFLPSKPKTREFCGGCHATETPETRGILKIDMNTHGQRYICWQCHYPHLPEG